MRLNKINNVIFGGFINIKGINEKFRITKYRIHHESVKSISNKENYTNIVCFTPQGDIYINVPHGEKFDMDYHNLILNSYTVASKNENIIVDVPEYPN